MNEAYANTSLALHRAAAGGGRDIISHKRKLALEKDILWSVCRAVIQLIIVGYVRNTSLALIAPPPWRC